jgi:tRNA modification GTPase
LSGNKALAIAGAVFFISGKSGAKRLIHGKMAFGEIRADGFSDFGYAVVFKAPRSFTGEDIAEFHCHGGTRILEGVVAACIGFGARLAEPGEFTKRALLNGKTDLAGAEGVIDMINAESAAAVRAASDMLNGKLGADIRALQDGIGALMENTEAVLDFPEETEDEVLPDGKRTCAELAATAQNMLSTARAGRMAKYGVDVVILGKPNAGKSSLLNAVLKKERAIVSATAGTTRDLVTDYIEYDGVKINFTDSAGLRKTDDEIEKSGVERAIKASLNADVVLLVEDDTDADGGYSPDLSFGAKTEVEPARIFLTVKTKCDLTGGNYGVKAGGAFSFAQLSAKSDGGVKESGTFPVVRLSSRFGDGVDVLLKLIVSAYKNAETGAMSALITSPRHISCLTACSEALAQAYDGYVSGLADCILIDLRRAYDALGQITGTTAGENLIDSIFSRFCVGK